MAPVEPGVRVAPELIVTEPVKVAAPPSAPPELIVNVFASVRPVPELSVPELLTVTAPVTKAVLCPATSVPPLTMVPPV